MYRTCAIEICSAGIAAALCPGNAQEDGICCCYKIAVRDEDTIEFQSLSVIEPGYILGARLSRRDLLSDGLSFGRGRLSGHKWGSG